MNLKLNTAMLILMPIILTLGKYGLSLTNGTLPHLPMSSLAILIPVLMAGGAAWLISRSSAFAIAWAMATLPLSVAVNSRLIAMKTSPQWMQGLAKAEGMQFFNTFLSNLGWVAIIVTVIVLLVFREDVKATLQNKLILIATIAALALLVLEHHWIFVFMMAAPLFTSYRSWGSVLPYLALVALGSSLMFKGNSLFAIGVVLFPVSLGIAWLIHWLKKPTEATV